MAVFRVFCGYIVWVIKNMATRKRPSAFGFSFFTFALLLLVVVESLWLVAFIYSEGSVVPPAVSAAFGGHKKEKPKATSLTYSDNAVTTAKEKEKEKKEPVAITKHKSETPVVAVPPKSTASATATATPMPVSTTAKKPAEGAIVPKDEQELQNLLTREGSKGKSAAAGEGL
jgi:hypothetical protein